MIDDDFLHSLPDDSDEALSLLFSELQASLERLRVEISQDRYEGQSVEEAERDLLISIFAFIDAHAIPLELNKSMPADSHQFVNYFKSENEKIRYYIKVTTYKRAANRKSGIGGIYILTPELRREIHGSIGRIRELIAEADLTETKREALSKKLNAFAEEVDRNRTKIEALASAIIWSRKQIEEGAKNLEPIVDGLTKMFESMAKATEFLKLPSSKETKKLPAPPKRIEGPKRELDDEVPF